ncbi:MAG TPA: hypothetical protein VNV65_00840 [Candidatus Solibacter sp.]|jgi:uncharacterized repeat protein (TIGR01451 family)|nr:hypothetical protein [Candidatus Solibacter sp.]
MARRAVWILCAAFASSSLGLSSCSFIPGDINLIVKQKDQTPQSGPTDFKTIEIEVDNTGSGTARGIVLRDALPTGFSYVSTKPTAGSAIRTRTADPPIHSPSPTWAAWSIPGGSARSPGKLVLDFLVAVSAAPGRTPNFVEVTSDDADPVAAPPLGLSVQPTAAMDLRIAAGRGTVAQGQTVRYTITVRNTGTAPAQATFISAALPSGFIFVNTIEISGNSARIGSTNPLPKSLLPSWGTWDVPEQEPGSPPGTLRIVFDANVVPSDPTGNYPISVTITYNDLPAQTVADQAVVNVTKKP